MITRISRRLVLGGLLSGLGAAGWAGAPETSLRPKARPGGVIRRTVAGPDALISRAKLGGDVAFSVIDVKTGLVLEEHGARAGQPPASVTKAVTALYALDVLGAGHRFETRLVADGTVSDGVLNGDLILAGGGDPTLDTDALAGLAQMLKAAGIREVRGKLRAWGGALPLVKEVDSSQPDHVGYNPTVSGLNLNFNRVHFEWKRQGGKYQVTMDARSKKYRPEVRVARMRVAARKAPVYTYIDQGGYDDWTVAQAALGNGGARWLPVRKPEAYATEVFASFARSHGIVLKPDAPVRSRPAGRVLAIHRSEPLRDILRDMLKYSNNLTAEVVGLSASAVRGGGRSLRASAQEMTRWARATLGMADSKFVDHSGLGAASRVTAAAMATALARVHRQGALQPILKPIAMLHDNGQVNKNHPVRVMAKTGTLYFVSSLAGYMTAPDGTELAFAIFTSNAKLRAGVDSQSGQRPDGAAGWNKRSKQLQQDLIERWSTVYGS